jgi:hypothetical protein
MCAKKCFNTRIDAAEAVIKAKLSRKTKRLECRYYWCSEHRAYHLTSMPRMTWLPDGRTYSPVHTKGERP